MLVDNLVRLRMKAKQLNYDFNEHSNVVVGIQHRMFIIKNKLPRTSQFWAC